MSTTIRKNSYYHILPLLLLLLFAACPLGEAAPVPATDKYALQLFTEDAVFRNPNSSISRYFEIYSGSTVTEPAVLDLWYSYSPTVRSDISSMTVSFNGVPVASRSLATQQTAMHNWQVELPVKYFKIGFNEVSVSVIHRSIDGLCRDIDNDANWLIIRPETKVSFGIARSPYTLSSYPRPLLDDYLAAKVNTVFYLPTDPDLVTIASLLNLATDWGTRKLPGIPQRLEARIGEPGQVPANEVVFGLTSQRLPGQNLPQEASVLTLSSLPNGYSRLYINGENSQNIAKAANALRRPQLVKTFSGQQIAFASPLPADINTANIGKKKKGLYTLVDLGHQEDITVAGAFHQEAVIVIPRPPNYKVGDSSYIELHFRHSKILDPKKSAVTVYINNIPIRSSALLAENAEKGTLRVPIPASELNKASWQVRFGFYHDLGIIDCSKRYDEVAWSVIEKTTTIFLDQGGIERIPALEDFPNSFFEESDGTVKLTMLLPEKPSQEELSSALKLAYFIGQHNNSKIVWQVQTITAFDAKKAPGTVIALGSNNDASQWSALKKYLPVSPEGNGNYQIASWLEVMSAGLNRFDMYQVAKITDEKLLYAFMYSNPNRMNTLLNFALLNGSALNGQLTLVDAQGNHTSFKQPASVSAKNSFDWLSSIVSGAGGVVGTYVAVFAAVLIATAALLFFMRKRP